MDDRIEKALNRDNTIDITTIGRKSGRRHILSDSVMAWYRRQVHSVDELVASSPLVEVLFED